MNCSHCNQAIGCGCNKVSAGDGAAVHKGCLSIYNKGLTQNVSITVQNTAVNLGQIVIPPTTAR